MDVMSFSPSNGNAFAHLGQAAAVAYDHRAPTDEVAGAGLELASIYRDAADLYPEEARVAMGDYHRLQEAERSGNRLLAKALRMTHPEAAKAKAQTQTIMGVLGGGGIYVQKPGLTFDALRSLSQRVEVARAIHMTRKRQVGRFSQPSEKDDQPGYRIKHQDPNHVLSDDETQYLQWLTSFLNNGGRDFRPWMRRRDGRRTFRSFIQEITDEGLTHDNAAIELVPLGNGVKGLDSFYLRDGGTFYLSAPNQNGIYAYQSLVGLPEVNFNHDQLALFQRNVSPYLEARGYGRSELEASIDTITSFLKALEYTRQGMDENAIPRGLLTVYGQFDQRTREMFQSAWQAKVRGVKNRFGLPVLFSRNGQAAAQYTATGQEFSEMAFAKWIGLQTSIMSAIYGIDPKEIGMDGFSSGNSNPLGGDDTAERLAASKDKGLEPFLADVEGFLSDEVLARFDPRYRLVFTGLDPMESAAKRVREEKVSTIDELRASLGMEPHPIKWIGELPADAGVQAAEFQRLQSVVTLDEGRRIWGGLEAYPDAALGASPLNPSLGALYQGAIAPDPPPGSGMDPNDPMAALMGAEPGGQEEDPESSDPEADDPDGQAQAYEDQARMGEDAEEPSQLHQGTADALRGMNP